MRETTRIAVDGENPPFTLRDELGEQRGFSIELCCLCLDQEGDLRFEVADGPMTQSIWLTTGRVDAILDMTASFRRERWYDFSQGYFVDELAVFERRDGPLWAGLDRVRGSLAVKSNSYAEEWLRRRHSGLQLRPVNEAVQLGDAVESGRAVGFVTSAATGQALNRDLFGDRFRQAGPSFAPAALTLAVAHAESSSLLRHFNRGLAEIRSDGRLDALLRRWALTPV
jgi:ABC-type amino acid transport substrate-binding protein